MVAGSAHGDTKGPAEERVVAIRPGALGDVLLTFPALSWLRWQSPGVRVALVARRDVLPLALDSGAADTVSGYDEPAWGALFSDEPPEPRGLAHEVCAGARVVAWTGEDDGLVRRNLLALGASAAVVAPGKPSPSSSRHMALQLCDALARLGYPAPDTLEVLVAATPTIQFTEDASERAFTWLREQGIASGRFVAVHPGSGGTAKRWPTREFATLLERLYASGKTPLLIEGPQDTGVVQDLLTSCSWSPDALHVASNLSVVELAALLARCATYVGNDSGVTHLAGLVGCQTVAIFGPTDPAIWQPVGAHVTVIRSPSGRTDEVSVDAVLRSLRGLARGE